MKNEENRTPADQSDDEQENVPHAIIGVLPVGATIGAGMAAGAPGSTGGQGAYSGGAALLPLVTGGNAGDTEDQRIAQEIETALAEEPTLSASAASAVQFSVMNQVLHLTGTVPTEHDRQAIRAIAGKQAGIAGINDEMRVA